MIFSIIYNIILLYNYFILHMDSQPSTLEELKKCTTYTAAPDLSLQF